MSDSPLRIVSNQPPESAPGDGSPPTPPEPDQERLAELRRLLVEPEQIQINNILERLNNPRVRARELSRSLPEAVRLRASQDESLTEALAPAIVTAFHGSIKKDPRPIAEAISPLMGPAIRRAISAALSSLIQSLDQTLKHSFSWQGLKWRIEALRSGKSFAEVVLSRTMIYRVEQVFLIHKQTGLLLHHVAASAVSTKDADLVSGMLTAIQDAIRNFARDSFGAGRDEPIEKLDLGDREVWFEPGPFAVLAVVIRGNAPETLRGDLFAPAIEAVHVEMRETLEAFDGDAAPFDAIRHHLEECLQSRYHAQTTAGNYKVPAYIWFLCALILLALAGWAFFSWRSHSRWNAYLKRLKSEHGIVVTETGWENGKRYISGLRDPLAPNPESILRQETTIAPESVVSRWESYQALDAGFVLKRARALLEPPRAVELKLENGVLTAVGAAPHRWVVDAHKFARAIPGVDSFNEQNLIDEDLREPEALRKQIEGRVIRFEMGKTQLIPGHNQTLNELVSELKKLIALAPSVSRKVNINLVGHTDTEGEDSVNQQLSRERAARILALLAARGIPKELMTGGGVGTKDPIRPETNPEDKQFNRSVSIKISLLDAAQDRR